MPDPIRTVIEEIEMSPIPYLAAHPARRRHVPAHTALGAIFLVAACSGAESSAAASVPPTITASPSSASIVAARSATPTIAALTFATQSPGPVITLPPAANPQTIHVLEDPGQFTFGHVGSFTGCTAEDCQGDTMIGRSRMLDAATRKVVGAFLVDCFLIDPAQKLYHCPANTITLTGRGQIVFTETLLWGGGGAGQDTWATWAPWPIIGGTGEFLGATGTVDSPADSTWSAGDFVITINE